MKKRISDWAFRQIHLSSIVYNTCWEDPRCDRELLELDATSEVVMITSAGCNALDYLLDGPARVHCIDMNPRQNALLELKKAFFQTADHDALFDFFGKGTRPEARRFFENEVEKALPAEAAQFWRTKIALFEAEKGQRGSFYYRGASGTVAWLVKKFLQTDRRAFRLAHELFETDSLEAQKKVWLDLEPRLMNGFFRWFFRQNLVQFGLGVPLSQRRLLEKHFPAEGLVGYVRHCFRKVFLELPAHENYFWELYLKGQYSPENCPNYLKKAHFKILRDRVERIETTTATIADFLEKRPAKYSHFVLLDHQDWLASHDRAALEDEWHLILENARPGAKILLRSASMELDFLPDFVAEKVDFDPTRTAASHRRDRVGTYGSAALGIVR